MALNVPISVLSDSYKASHFQQYPKAVKMVAYGEFRSGYEKDTVDTRIVFYGMRYLVETYIERKWSLEDIDESSLFYQTHMAPAFTQFPYPRDLFRKFVLENNGYFPVRIEALQEGTCCHARVPVYQVTAEGEYAVLCTFLETLLTMVWYPTTVATLSRRARDVVEASFQATSDGGRDSPLVVGRLHDFGFRGCTTPEQSIVGGCAHLLNFQGSDTMSAAYYAQFRLNGGRPVAQSVPATEHSVMTSWDTEQAAIENMLTRFGDASFSCVMDSYNYGRALDEVLPAAVAAVPLREGGFMVLRPDSGDPVQSVLMGLRAAEKVFGADTNGRGFKVVRRCGVLQGDGIDIHKMAEIAAACAAAGYAADSVLYGMGGGLLQKVHRDTLSFVTKLSHIVHADGRAEDIMKRPQGDRTKHSLPGMLAVKRVDGVPTAYPADSGEVADADNLMRCVYDNGPVAGCWDEFDTLKLRVATEWRALPLTANTLSASLKAKVATQLAKGEVRV